MPRDFDAEKKFEESKEYYRQEEKDSVNNEREDFNDYLRRSLKWLTFAKPKLVSGFDHLSPSDVPIMAAKHRGISLALEKIVGWVIPFSQFKNINQHEDEFTVQLSFSLFHFNSKSFFGSTWMGAQVSLSDSKDMLPVVIDVEYNELIYLISRLTDPSCVGIAEIVVSKIKRDKNVISAQYGCGWTMIKLFETGFPDISDGADVIISQNSPVFEGSPRDLTLHPNLSVLVKSLKQIPNCSIEYKLMSHKKLLRAQGLIAENEIIGRFDVIGGLIPKKVTLPGDAPSDAIVLPCLGDNDKIDPHVQIGGRYTTSILPTNPEVALPYLLRISSGMIVCTTNRNEVERRMALHVSHSLSPATGGHAGVQIISRTLKIGLHNGHTLLGGEWTRVALQEDKEDRDVLLPLQPIVELDGYVPHEVTAILFLIEYEFRSISDQLNAKSSASNALNSVLSSTLQNGRLVTTITVGAASYVPYDGNKLVLHNHPLGEPDSDVDGDLKIQLDIRTDDVCFLVSSKPLFIDVDDDGVSYASSTLGRSVGNHSVSMLHPEEKVSSKLPSNGHGPSALNHSRPRAGSATSIASINAFHHRSQMYTSFSIAFDLDVIDVQKGIELKHGQSIDIAIQPPINREQHEYDSIQNRNSDSAGNNFLPNCGSDDTASVASERLSHTKRLRASKISLSDNHDTLSILSQLYPPLVEGNEDLSVLQLDSQYYESRKNKSTHRRDRDEISDAGTEMSGLSSDSRFRLPTDKNSLLRKLANVRLSSDRRTYQNGEMGDDEMLFERPYSKSKIQLEGIATAYGPNYVDSHVSPLTHTHVRELTRAARARLGRFGMDGSNFAPSFNQPLGVGSNSRTAMLEESAHRRLKEFYAAPYGVSPSASDAHIPALIETEVSNGNLQVHEFTVQFAGFRSVNSKSQSSVAIEKGSAGTPRSVFFTYQFYTCRPTRTEVLRLLPAGTHETNILVRESSHARDEIPMALKYSIDCSGPSVTDTSAIVASNPLYEAREFAEYLARQSLFLEVWNADSLLLLGTCGVPLQKLMCQGKAYTKCSLECDIIDSAISSIPSDGIETSVISRGCPVAGSVVGSVQIVLTHVLREKPGAKGKPSTQTLVRRGDSNNRVVDSEPGINWRAFGASTSDCQIGLAGPNRATVKPSNLALAGRPRTRVRAVPLSETAPELSKVLSEHHQANVETFRTTTNLQLSRRSLSSIRGDPTNHTLTYDDIILLFRRFQGSVKGTLQYKGQLMKLLDVPSWSVIVRKVLNVFNKMERISIDLFQKELKQYSDNYGKISIANIVEFFKYVFDKFGIGIKSCEAVIIAKRFEQSSNSLQEIVDFCRNESNRLLWQSAGRKLRYIAHRAAVVNFDIEQCLADFDKDGDGFITSTLFRNFLKSILNYGKLCNSEISSIVRHFSRHRENLPGDTNLKAIEQTVSLKEVCAFIGVTYVGNVPALIRRSLGEIDDKSNQMALSQILQKSILEHNRGTEVDRFVIDDVENALIQLGGFNVASIQQFRTRLKKDCLDQTAPDSVTMKKLFDFLSLPIPTSQGTSGIEPEDTDDVIKIDATDYFRESANKDSTKVNLRSTERNSQGIALTNEELIQQIQRVAKQDGGVEGLLAFLDDDGDGLISLNSFIRLLKRENVFDLIDQYAAAKLLKQFGKVNEKDELSAASLLRYLEGNADNSDDFIFDAEFQSELKTNTQDKESDYEYSTDPEVHALEKKIRNLGHVVANKGVDVESIFMTYDAKQTGMIRRTDFVDIMSNLGLYILEKGRVMDNANELINDENDVRRQQLIQIKRIKGETSLLHNDASRMARKLVMGSAVDEGIMRSQFTEHLESMALINWYRQSQKKLLLQRVLTHSLSASISIFPRFGKTVFFEYPVTNPFGHEERFTIALASDETELKLVSRYEEWIHLRSHCRACTEELGEGPVEAEVFDRDERGQLQVALLPHETFHLPFAFLSLVPLIPPATLHNNDQLESNVAQDESNMKTLYDGEINRNQAMTFLNNSQRTVIVKLISASHGHVVSVLNVNIYPRPFAVNRTIRYVESENRIAKRRIKAIGYDSTASHFPEDSSACAKYIHCVEYSQNNSKEKTSSQQRPPLQAPSNVVIEWRESTSTVTEFLLRYRCGRFDQPLNFFILLYDDPFQCRLREIWSIVVEPRQRIDLQGCIGNATSVDLVVKGDGTPRRVRAYSSAASGSGAWSNSVSFTPSGSFQLIPGAFNRVTYSSSLRLLGHRRSQVNIVDADSRELVSAWVVNTNVSAPQVLRTYDISMSAQQPLHKKIVFKNPWSVSRRFSLHSSDDNLMVPRSPFLDMAPCGSAYVRLLFNCAEGSTVGLRGHLDPSMNPQEVYLFLNDESGQNEECFLFRVTILV